MGLKGSLAELALPHLVKMTALGTKSGVLVLYEEEGSVVGTLAFRDGNLADAVCGELHGEKAFYALLELDHGSFDFDPSAPVARGTCELPTEGLLIEGMRRRDELALLREQIPPIAAVRFVAGAPGDPVEARLLDALGSQVVRVDDLVNSALAGGEIDTYDALTALVRLAARAIVSVEGSLGSSSR